MKKVILDVDTGIDDALAIMLAIKSGELEILGITNVAGNVSLERVTDNTIKVLDLVGALDIPVYRGASAPLVRPAAHEHRIHGEDGLGGALADVQASRLPQQDFAADFIAESAKKNSGVSLVMTAPMTNLALALHRFPSLPDYVDELIFMGGVAHGPGNRTPVAEFNMLADPEAARKVLHAGFRRITQVGLDVTRKTILRPSDIERIEDPKIRAYVAQSTAQYMQHYEGRNGVGGCALHDPLAVGVAIRPQFVKSTKFYVDIETQSSICDGQTVCDVQNRLGKDPNVEVCEEVDGESFVDFFIATLGRPVVVHRI